MKKEFKNPISIRQINSDDTEAFKEYWDKRQAETPHKSVFDKESPTRDKNIQTFLSNTATAVFGLFKGKKMKGQTMVSFYGDTAEFTGSHILKDNRGKGLANLLHAKRFDHLKKTGFDGTIKTVIQDTNTRSINAATRNGFSAKPKRNPNDTHTTYSPE